MFKLELPKKIKIHPIFHILLLELVNSNTSIQNKLFKLLENKYKIEKIEDYNILTNQYLMKWKKYDKDKNIWEIRNNFTEKILRILAQYEYCRKIHYIKNFGFPK